MEERIFQHNFPSSSFTTNSDWLNYHAEPASSQWRGKLALRGTKYVFLLPLCLKKN